MKIIFNARFIGLAIICAMFCFGQETWPPTTTITVEQEVYKPAQYVILNSSADFFHVLTEDDPPNTHMSVAIEGQEIPVSVVNERQAAFPLPYVPDITERTSLTGVIEGVSFTVEVDPPEPAPGGAEAEITTFLSRYQQVTTIMYDTVIERAGAELTDPEEEAAVVTAASQINSQPAQLATVLLDLLTNYPEAADILASTIYTSGTNQILQDFIDEYSGGLPTGKANCNVAYVLAVIDTFLDAGLEIGSVVAFSSWAGAAAMKLLGAASVPAIEAVATKMGGAGGAVALGSGLMLFVTPNGGGDTDDLIITAPDTTLEVGLPGETAPLWVQAELETEDDSLSDIFKMITGRAGSRNYGMTFNIHGFVFEVYIPWIQTAMPSWWNKPFGIRKIIVDVPNDEVGWYTFDELMIDVFPAEEPDADCNQLIAQALFIPGEVTVHFSWLAFNRSFTVEQDYLIIQGPIVEAWPGADGTYTGSSGEIEGNLGTWKYLWMGDQMTTDPCDRRIVVSGGELTAYECHHEIGGDGFGKVWVWLDNFRNNEQFYPIDHVYWDFSSSGEFGPDGYAYFFVGQLESGMHYSGSGGALSPAGNDFMCLRPPSHQPESGGSMYFGAILYSNYHWCPVKKRTIPTGWNPV